LNPWPRELHASALARSYLDSLLIIIRNIYIYIYPTKMLEEVHMNKLL
jgi:hypothetical protein